MNLCSVLSKFTGKPASLYEIRHVDWVPTQNLGYSTAKVTNEDLSRNKWAINRGIKRARIEETAKSCLHVGKESIKVENEGQEKSCQTDFNLGILKEELSMAKHKLLLLSRKFLLINLTENILKQTMIGYSFTLACQTLRP